MQVRSLNPASPEAAHLLWLWHACMWVCGLVLAVVGSSLLYILMRFRQRDNREPRQVTGSTKLEITWTVVPIMLVGTLFVLSVMTEGAVQVSPRQDPDIVVTGHQWWWESALPVRQCHYGE